MLKYFIILFCFLLFISKSYEFYLNKYYSQLQVEYKNMMEDVELLKAEWRPLTDPARLSSLQKRKSKKHK